MKLELKKFLKDYEKLVIFGIGNSLKGDDGLGSYFVNILKNNLKLKLDAEKNENDESIILIDAGLAPENFTGEIKRENPSHILIIDAALMDLAPGTIKVIEKEEIADVNISTHSMSLSYLIKYLEIYHTFHILFIGIQPLSMELGEELSPKILESVNYLKNLVVSELC
ncbi:hydrogenase 3 maturation protease [Methanobrevibacter cuticularis]|uniref:Hydrogenase 3 maturation protease n=1 Tax=Methanobrevibacter cuticularis TaxID=47311 RepID=A0A166E3F4_9EURY|nr:hydrogenase maturation peptidase HycI [Methanobrevibacter cuticularis]KZX16238.1 hydrogenase 3 maturation protease [Methanobrevibacter cuticularis]